MLRIHTGTFFFKVFVCSIIWCILILGEEAACWRNLHPTGLLLFWWLCFSPWESLAWEGDTDFEGGRPGKVFLAYVVIGKRRNGTNKSMWCEELPKRGRIYPAPEAPGVFWCQPRLQTALRPQVNSQPFRQIPPALSKVKPRIQPCRPFHSPVPPEKQPWEFKGGGCHCVTSTAPASMTSQRPSLWNTFSPQN